MATRTISATGGNWNATTTWVEGIVPVAGDDVVGLATSGNLTINVNTANLLQYNLSQYLGTLTLNGQMNVGGALVGTSSFSPTMSFATSTAYSDTNCFNLNNTTNTHFIRTNGKVIPWLQSSKGGGANQFTPLDDIYATTLSIGYGNQSTTVNGTYSLYIQHFNRSGNGGGSTGTLNAASTATLYFIGPTSSYSMGTGNGASPMCISNIDVVIDTGTFSTNSPFALGGMTTLTKKYFWKSGILAGTKQLMLLDGVSSGTVRLDFATAGTWSNVYYNDVSSVNADRKLELLSDLYFDILEQTPINQSLNTLNATLRRPLTTSGTGALKGGRLISIPLIQGALINAGPQNIIGTPTYSTPILKLVPGPQHTLSRIDLMGYTTGIDFRNTNQQASRNGVIQSSTASVRATLNYTGTIDTPSFYVQYTDIDASGGNTIYNFGGSQSNSLNIGTMSFDSTKAFTFVN